MMVSAPLASTARLALQEPRDGLAADPPPPGAHHGSWRVAALGALGVVFGDIGTSPLYAFQVAIRAAGPAPSMTPAVMGIISLIFWALTIVVALKYVTIVMNADNDGEGGILALLSLVTVPISSPGHRLPFLVVIGVCGAALLFGDGIITPAISVLSAVEGLKVAVPNVGGVIVPATLVILIGLFLIQRFGTAAIGKLFGPVMAGWFVIIGVLGIRGIVEAPQILEAINPRYAVDFLIQAPTVSFAVFGATFLALTGAEALYADMGHFSARAIRIAWFGLVFPALLLNYFGQGALLLQHPDAADNPFFKLAPPALVLPIVILATAATVIASQALISGVFSLTRQAMIMRLSPRMQVVSTSSLAYGQIYISVVNWALMCGTLAVVITFRTSDSLAAAYGIAVSGTMLITTILLHDVMRHLWRWPAALAGAVTALFGAIDATFMLANATKIADGGWLPLAIGSLVATIMIAWRLGTSITADHIAREAIPLSDFLAHLDETLVARLPGCGVFVTRQVDRVSPMILHHVAHNRVLHENVVLLTVVPTRRPRISASERLEIQSLGHGFHRITVKIGFMQRPDIATAIRGCAKLGLEFCRDNVHYYIAHESIVRRQKHSALSPPIWAIFNFLNRMSLRSPDYFHLPPKAVMEVGFRVEI
ncbi:MAG: KUP/HAK/KT family potassium transporter [Azospirillaceae bacterium]|nr:KUP/HAK/KT family potassium transporter [Azospirillaceae bacterium]